VSQRRGVVRFAGAARLSITLLALWKLFKHPQTPLAVKVLAILVVAYAVSPIDLIPDFIPILGLLDDVVLVSLGVALVVKLTPRPLWEACLRDAETGAHQLPRMLWGAALVVGVWVLLAGLFGAWIFGTIARGA
jgi:uncharacterized membrane protein YkvA (DUF1232 family)